MSLAGYAGGKPPRISITNLRTGETKKLPYVPEKFKETVNANYTKQTVLGMSHQILQYSHTDSHTFSELSFFFRGESEKEVDLIHDGRKFLLSLMYPSVDAENIRNGGPPRVLFIWPQVVSMTCIIEKMSIMHERFNVQGKTVQFKADLGFTEIRDTRITSEEIREQGTQRSSAQPEEAFDEYPDWSQG